jgi:hypothetical protein
MTIEVFEREAKEVTLDLGAPEQAKPLDVQPVDEPTTKKSAVPVILMIAGYGIGVAGGVVSAITGAMSISQTSDIKKDCGGTACPPSEKSKIDSANTLATISTIALIGAGVGAAIGVTGTILFFSKPGKTALRGTIGVGSLSLEGTF